jgi:hypothetical protein
MSLILELTDDVINFYYETEQSIARPLDYSEQVSHSINGSNITSTPVTVPTYSFHSTGTTQKILTSIVGLKTKAVFQKENTPREDLYSDQIDWHALHKIDLIDNLTNENIKSFELNYSYFNNHLQGKNYAKRLKLLSVQELDKVGHPERPPYVFDYIDGVLPFKDSKAQDHHGYYNGATSNSVFTPKMGYGVYILPGANRSFNFDFAKIGTLNKITYPEGGFTELEYEPNTFGNFSEIYKRNEIERTKSLHTTPIVLDFSTPISTANFVSRHTQFRAKLCSTHRALLQLCSIFPICYWRV